MLNTNIGMGNTYKDEQGMRYSSLAGITGEAGNLISNTLSGRLNAYVDIAKDPYIFYLNNNDGLTILEDGTEIQNLENRLLLFDSSKDHNGTTCTNADRRLLINFSYF